MRNRLIRILSTVFGVGYSPLVPGTCGSLAGLLLYLLIRNNLFLYLGITVLSMIVGFAVAGKAEELFKTKDPREVVIDELSGMLIVYLLVPYSLSNLVIGFIIFRLMDFLKLYPIQKLERLSRGWGIMLDDIAAAVYTNIILQILIHIRGVF